MQRPNPASQRHGGFKLVELVLLLVILGVLTSFSVPRFLKSIERARAAEAFEYLTSVRSAQERYQAQYGTYATTITDLDIKNSPPKCFLVPTTFSPAETSSLQDSWTLTLTRIRSSTSYGAYTVAFTETGFDTSKSTIAQPPASTEISPIHN